jgi:hypothetical protein
LIRRFGLAVLGPPFWVWRGRSRGFGCGLSYFAVWGVAGLASLLRDLGGGWSRGRIVVWAARAVVLACALVYKLPSKRGQNPVSVGACAHSVVIWTGFAGLAPVLRLVRKPNVHARARACSQSFAAPKKGRGRGARPLPACRRTRADPRIFSRVPLLLPTCCRPARGRSY